MLLAACLTLLASAVSCGDNAAEQHKDQNSHYRLLDAEIAAAADYERVRERRIAHLRTSLTNASNEFDRYEITNRLISEYDAYKADSAIHYVNVNLDRPIVASHPEFRHFLLIRKADLYAHAGLFSDALQIMERLPSASLEPALKEQYYATYCALYQYLSEYNTDTDPEPPLEYERKRGVYVDSLRSVADSLSLNHLIYAMPQLARSGRPQEAIATLRKHLKDYPSGSREYSILASILAYVYKTVDDRGNYLHYLTESAISDVRGAVKENMSFREMATNMFEDGDIQRANLYLKKSIADANFFSARMRNAQSTKMLPVIDEAYAASQNRLRHLLEWMIAAVSLLALGLVVALLYIRKQYKSLKKANENVASTNAELSVLSDKLKVTNAELARKNASLSESNMIKEQYTGLFMEYSSSVISTLQKYHHSLKVLANQGIAKTTLVKKLDSSEFIDTALKNFYARFDEAILNIYPDFISKVNALLRPDGIIVTKEGELLNTELRVLALIRIGITDSTKIAEFLRCSVTTVYTYRSKLRHRAADPSTFEAKVAGL